MNGFRANLSKKSKFAADIHTREHMFIYMNIHPKSSEPSLEVRDKW